MVENKKLYGSFFRIISVLLISLCLVDIGFITCNASAENSLPFKLFDGHPHNIADDTVKYPRIERPKDGSHPPGGPDGFGGIGAGLPAGSGGQPSAKDPNPVKAQPDSSRFVVWMDQEGVEGAALIQKKGSYGLDNSYILDSTIQYKEKLMPVVILDPMDENTPESMVRMIKNNGLAGIRLTGQAADDGSFPWLDSPQALKVWDVVENYGLVMDLMLFETGNLPDIVALITKMAESHPNARIVLDHALYPPLEGAPDYGINMHLRSLAKLGNVYFKFTTINLDLMREKDLSSADFVRHLVDVYGADHVLWGSDIGNSAGTYEEIVERIIASTEKLSEDEKRAVLYSTGKNVFVRGGKKGFSLTNDQLLTRVAIEALCVEYFYLLDHGRAVELADLFTENGVQDFGGERRLVGRDPIREYYAERSKTRITRHITTNLRLVYESADRVRGLRAFTHYAGEASEGELPPAIPSVAEYEEVFERGSDGIWRFAYRKPISVFDKKE